MEEHPAPGIPEPKTGGPCDSGDSQSLQAQGENHCGFCAENGRGGKGGWGMWELSKVAVLQRC